MTDRIRRAPVLAAVDGSIVGFRAVAWAATEAALFGCPLHLLTSTAGAGGPQPAATDAVVRWLREEGERVLAEASRVARTAVTDPALEITTEVTDQPVAEHLIRRSPEVRMLVVGSRGLGAVRRGLLGSVSSAVTRHAHCPVTVVHTVSATDAVTAALPILVGIDGTENSVPALEAAFEEASRRRVGLVALHAWSDISSRLEVTVEGWTEIRTSEEALLAESLAGFAERYPQVEVRRVLVYHRPVRSLLDEAENAQLVVVGSRGRGGFAGLLLGSTAAALVQSADCPVMVVRGTG